MSLDLEIQLAIQTERVKVLEEYIAYLAEADTMVASHLTVHGWKWPEDLLKRGEEIRERLANLPSKPSGWKS